MVNWVGRKRKKIQGGSSREKYLTHLMPSDLTIRDSWHPTPERSRLILINSNVRGIHDGLWRSSTYNKKIMATSGM